MRHPTATCWILDHQVALRRRPGVSSGSGNGTWQIGIDSRPAAILSAANLAWRTTHSASPRAPLTSCHKLVARPSRIVPQISSRTSRQQCTQRQGNVISDSAHASQPTAVSAPTTLLPGAPHAAKITVPYVGTYRMLDRWIALWRGSQCRIGVRTSQILAQIDSRYCRCTEMSIATDRLVGYLTGQSLSAIAPDICDLLDTGPLNRSPRGSRCRLDARSSEILAFTSSRCQMSTRVGIATDRPCATCRILDRQIALWRRTPDENER